MNKKIIFRYILFIFLLEITDKKIPLVSVNTINLLYFCNKMSQPLEKYEQNKIAFAHLKAHKNCFAPAIHCGYYSCFQRVRRFLIDYYKDEFDELNEGVPGGKGATHGRTIKFFSKKYKKDIDHDEGYDLRKKLMELKSYRVEADYSDLEITEAKVKKVEQIMIMVEQKIKSLY